MPVPGPLDLGNFAKNVSASTGDLVAAQVAAGAVSVAAFATGGQTGATALTGAVNRVTTAVATAPPYDSVKLPASVAGLFVVVVNVAANPIQVFGAGTDTINGVAAATGITQPASSVDFYICTVAGQWQVDPGIGYSGGLFTEISQDAITANAAGGQASATQLTAQTNRITVAANTATPYSSVKLPPSAAGLEVLVINHAPNSIQVFGAGTDQIDDQPTATGVTQMMNSFVIYSCAAGGNWYSEGLGTGFSGQYPTVSFMNAITAFATGGQASATPLTTVLNRVTTVGTIGDSVKLPASAAGMQITVTNAAANSLNVFPVTGDSMNGTLNGSLAIAGGKSAVFSCALAGQWYSVLSA